MFGRPAVLTGGHLACPAAARLPTPPDSPMAPPVLALKNARLRIGQQELFAGLDAMLARGDRVCLVGRNGSGKSTLLRVLAGLIELDSGEVFTQPRVTIAYLPQEPQLPAGATSADLVLLGLPAAERGDAARYRADILLADLGMEPERGAPGPLRRRDPPRLAGPGAGRRARGAAAGRAHQPSRPADHRMAGGAPRGLRRLVRRDQPRPPLPDPPLDPDLVARPRHPAQQRQRLCRLRGMERAGAGRRGSRYPAPRQAAGGRDALAAPRRHRPPQAQHGPAAPAAGPAPAAPPADRPARHGQAARRHAGASAAGW